MARGWDEAWYFVLFIWRTQEVSRSTIRAGNGKCGALYGPGWADWHTDRLAVVAGLSAPSRCALNEPLECVYVCVGVCGCPRQREREREVEREREREQERTGCIRFPWLARCWPQSYLDTLTFSFCLAVQSEHRGLFTHISVCRATPGQVSAMQWLPSLSSAASVRHPWVYTDRLKCTRIQTPTCISTHRNAGKKTTHAHARTGLNWTAAAPLLKGWIVPVNPISSLSSSLPNPPNLAALFAFLSLAYSSLALLTGLATLSVSHWSEYRVGWERHVSRHGVRAETCC